MRGRDVWMLLLPLLCVCAIHPPLHMHHCTVGKQLSLAFDIGQLQSSSMIGVTLSG